MTTETVAVAPAAAPSDSAGIDLDDFRRRLQEAREAAEKSDFETMARECIAIVELCPRLVEDLIRVDRDREFLRRLLMQRAQAEGEARADAFAARRGLFAERQRAGFWQRAAESECLTNAERGTAATGAVDVSAGQPHPMWPSRAAWEADAERAVRTACYPHERLRQETDYATPLERQDRERALSELEQRRQEVLHRLAAAANELRGQLPDMPDSGFAFMSWAMTQPKRRLDLVARYRQIVRDRQALRARQIGLAEVLRRHGLGRGFERELHVLEAIDTAVRDRELAASATAEQDAVNAEIARRATDEAWLEELERRAQIDGTAPEPAEDPRDDSAPAATTKQPEEDS